MGYTHYFYVPKEFSKDLFSKVVTDFKKILPEIENVKVNENAISSSSYSENDDVKIKIVDGHGKVDSKPEITNNLICFNGSSQNSHETFFLERKTQTTFTRQDGSTYENDIKKNGKYFEFCKTARKPYDLGVTTCLIIAKHYFNDQIEVRSDGEINDEWVFAKKFVQKHLGYGKDFQLDEEDQ